MRLSLFLALFTFTACDDNDEGDEPPMYFDIRAPSISDAVVQASDIVSDSAIVLDSAIISDAITADSEPPEPDGGSDWIEGFAQAAAAIECERRKACFGRAGLRLSPYDSCSPGQQARRALDLVWMAEAWTAQSLWVQHPEHMEACLDALEMLPCRHLDQGFPPTCRDLFAGALPTNAHCVMDEVCADNGFCDIVDPCFGVCQPRHPEGQACFSNRDCEWGLSCVLGICGPAQPEGGDCAWSDACQEGLFCLLGEGVEGTCRSNSEQFAQGLNEACGMHIGGNACQEGLSCVLSGDEGVCATPAPLGARCAFGTPNPCAEGLYCKFNNDIYNGRCERIPALGERCEPDEFSEPCGYEAGCINNRCQALKSLGSPCTVDEECASFDCISAHCEYGFACD